MKGQPYHNYITLDGTECHARKGWRGMARPAGTNRRRRLILQGALTLPISKEGRKHFSIWSQTRAWWKKTKAEYVEHRTALAKARAAEIEKEIVAALLAEKAKAAT